MKPLFITCALLVMSGCANQPLTQTQLSELKALAKYHQAEVELTLAESVLDTTAEAMNKAALKKIDAENNLMWAKEELLELLPKE